MDRFDELLRTDVVGFPVNESTVAHFGLTAAQAVAADDDGLLTSTALTTAAVTKTVFANPMPYARNVQIVASAAATTKITINGTNIAGQAISEELSLTGTTPVLGAKAFKTVTSAVLPIKTGTETVKIGWGDIIGLPFLLTKKPLTFAMVNGAIESTAPALTIDSDELEKNTIDLNSNLAGTAVEIYMML
jgi:hypothetical protein